MKNTFGSNLTLTLFGESHGPAIGAVLDGLAPGMDVDEAFIASQLTLRRPAGKIGTARREEDRFQILSRGEHIPVLRENRDREQAQAHQYGQKQAEHPF